MRIDPEWWPRLSELLDQWLDLPPDSRNQWLDRLGPEHADVLAVLRELVLHQPAAEAADFLGALPVFRNDADVVTTCELPVQFAVGMLMGPYRLVRELGVGGMGVVWLAERADGTLKRQVALKLPLLSAHNSRFAERLLREREILARLNHPHIAHLYDAGISLGGHPYFAMEYVEGEPLIGYCDRRRLNLERRLIIFVAVLRAVQYAHSNLVVHRDLKPSNILVTGSGEVRLLDFGVAKLLTEGVADATELTRIGGRALTPEYASPEQITNQAITTASDIYSLGVILYQLLCGERPYRLKRNTAGSLEEAILTADVIRPSRRITRAAQAEACGCTPRKLETTLRGDLDSIVLKALEKEPARRYSTADAFAQDIERYRSGEPVLAQPESRLYRMRKFVLRNKLAIASAAVVAAGLSIGLGVALWQTYAAILQKQRADTEAATARAVNDFLENDLLAAASARVQAGPRERPDPDLKVRTVLDRAAARIAGKFHKQPLVEASIRQTIHAAYMDLGLYAEAQQQAELVLQLRRSALGDEHRDTLAAMNNLATVYQVEGKIGRAESLLSRVFTLQKRVLGSTHPDTLESMSTLALLYSDQGRYADAELLLKQGLKLAHGALNERNPVVLTMMNNLALMYRRLDKHAQAEELYTAVLNLRRRDLGEEHPDTLITMNNLAVLYSAEHKYTQAEPLFAKVLEVRNQVLGKDHPSTLVSMNTLAVLYREEKRYADAERLLADVLERRRRVLGEDHPATLNTMNYLGGVYQIQGKYAQAEPVFARTVELRRRVLGDEHPDTLDSMYRLAIVYREEAKHTQAESVLTKVLNARRRIAGPEHRDTADMLVALSEVKLLERKYRDAESLLRGALRVIQRTAPDSWKQYRTESMLGASLAGQQKYDEAEHLLISGYRGMTERVRGASSESRAALEESAGWIIQFYRDRGMPRRVEEWARHLREIRQRQP